MARAQSRFVCQACGADFLRWEGQCRSCAAWNTLVETVVTARAARAARARSRRRRRGASPSRSRRRPTAPTSASRRASRELDRVLGGGIVPGSLLLIGGEPGVGKSTLLLQVAGGVAGAAGGRRGVLYATGEESAAQVRLRAARLGLGGGPAADAVDVLATSEVGAIVEVARARRPALVVVDSIQTMTVDELDGPAGSVGQVRESALRLMELAKGEGIAVVLVGHVTKDGSIAGPRTLEHLVDAVIDLGGERGGVMRLVRASKNRFGSTDELGVLRDGRGRAARGRRSRARVPRRARRRGAGQRRRGDDGGHPAAARRGPGARLAGGLRHARAPRLRASTRPGSRCCSRSSAGAPASASGATTSTRTSPAA